MSDTGPAPQRWFPYPTRYLIIPVFAAVGLALMLARHWGLF